MANRYDVYKRTNPRLYEQLKDVDEKQSGAYLQREEVRKEVESMSWQDLLEYAKLLGINTYKMSRKQVESSVINHGI